MKGMNMIEIELSKRIKNIQGLDEEEQNDYRLKYRKAFEDRVEAECGDGILLEMHYGMHTVKFIDFKENVYYFLALTSGAGSWTTCIAEANINTPDRKKVDVEDFPIDEQVFMFQQLLTNPWIEGPKGLENCF